MTQSVGTAIRLFNSADVEMFRESTAGARRRAASSSRFGWSRAIENTGGPGSSV